MFASFRLSSTILVVFSQICSNSIMAEVTRQSYLNYQGKTKQLNYVKLMILQNLTEDTKLSVRMFVCLCCSRSLHEFRNCAEHRSFKQFLKFQSQEYEEEKTVMECFFSFPFFLIFGMYVFFPKCSTDIFSLFFACCF